MAYSATAFQLTHLLQRVYRKLKVARSSTATGGSTTTIEDTKLLTLLGDSNEDDFLNNWTVILTYDAGGAGAAPEGEFGFVSDYDDAGTMTFAAFTAAVGSGDRYMYVSPDFPLNDMIDIVNDALGSLGWIPAVDTSITTVAAQTEHTLPVLVKGNPLLNVQIQGITTDSNDNRWIDVPNWEIAPAAPGSTGTIRIPQYPAGYTVRVHYLGRHPRVTTYANDISEFIHPELAVSAVVAHALRWYNGQSGGNDDFWLRLEDRAWNQFDISKAQFPIILPNQRYPTFPSFGPSVSSDRLPDMPFPP